MWEDFVLTAPIFYLLAVGGMFWIWAYYRDRHLNEILSGTSVEIRMWVLGLEAPRQKPSYPEFLWLVQLIKRSFWIGFWAMVFFAVWISREAFSFLTWCEIMLFVLVMILVLQTELRNMGKVNRLKTIPELAGRLGMGRMFAFCGGLLMLSLIGFVVWLIILEENKEDSIERRVIKMRENVGEA